MPTIPVHLNNQEFDLLNHFAHTNGETLPNLLRLSSIKLVQSKIDISIYETAYEKYLEEPTLTKTEELANLLRNKGAH